MYCSTDNYSIYERIIIFFVFNWIASSFGYLFDLIANSGNNFGGNLTVLVVNSCFEFAVRHIQTPPATGDDTIQNSYVLQCCVRELIICVVQKTVDNYAFCTLILTFLCAEREIIRKETIRNGFIGVWFQGKNYIKTRFHSTRIVSADFIIEEVAGHRSHLYRFLRFNFIRIF